MLAYKVWIWFYVAAPTNSNAFCWYRMATTAYWIHRVQNCTQYPAQIQPINTGMGTQTFVADVSSALPFFQFDEIIVCSELSSYCAHGALCHCYFRCLQLFVLFVCSFSLLPASFPWLLSNGFPPMLLQLDECRTYIISTVNIDIDNSYFYPTPSTYRLLYIAIIKYADNEEKQNEWDYFMKTDGEIRDELMSYSATNNNSSETNIIATMYCHTIHTVRPTELLMLYLCVQICKRSRHLVLSQSDQLRRSSNFCSLYFFRYFSFLSPHLSYLVVFLFYSIWIYKRFTYLGGR